MKQIKLQNSNKTFIISDCDFNLIEKYKWFITTDGYVRATINKKRLFIHRFLLNPSKDKVIDHIDGNPLNNTRENLRIATSQQNCINSFKKPGLSIYKGVSYDKNAKRKKRWMARCEFNNKNITIGRFLTENEAAEAYNKKALEIWGNYAVLNDIKNRKQIRQ